MEKNTSGEMARNAVLQRVSECFDSLAGSSGHLASYSIDAETFTIDRVEELESGARRYFFSARARYESEFTVYDEHTKPEIHAVSGSLTLDRSFGFLYDENGEVLLEPFKTLMRKPAANSASLPHQKNVLSRDDIDKLLGG